jgi:PST family polysaccharide transporter
MGLLVFISAFGTQHGAILQRRMQFKAGAFLEAAGTLGGLIVSIVAAYILKGYWALYFGIAAGTIIPVIGIWWIIRWRPTSPQIISGTKDMLRFGAGITTTNLTNFLARNMDNVLIGRRWGEQELGLYDRAYKLLLFPLQRIVYPVGAIMVPVLSRLLSEPDRYRAIYLKTIKQLAFVTWPGIIWAAVLSDPLIPTLLGKNWEGTAPIFQFLAAAGLMQAFGGITGPLFVSQGRSGDMAKWSILSAAISIGAFLIGLPYGALGVAAAYAIVECVRSPFGWWWATHKGPIKPEDIFWASVPLVAGGIGAGLAVYALKIYVRLPPLFLLASGLIAAYVAASLMMCLFKDGRDTLRHSLAVAESLLKRIISKESY